MALKKTKLFIIDDESSFRSVSRAIIEQHLPQVDVVGEAGSLEEAMSKLWTLQPDVLLLDIDLGANTGFDLLDQIPAPDFKIIFVTAHNDFAIKAFRYNAIDYLLKPIISSELLIAVQKAIAQINHSNYRQQLQQFRQQITSGSFDQIILNTGDGLLFTRTSEIVRLEANGNYSFVYLENSERHLVSISLADFEEMLSSPPFFRSHQSHIVNLAFVRKFSKAEGDFLQMVNQSTVPLARRRKDMFMDLINT